MGETGPPALSPQGRGGWGSRAPRLGAKRQRATSKRKVPEGCSVWFLKRLIAVRKERHPVCVADFYHDVEVLC